MLEVWSLERSVFKSSTVEVNFNLRLFNLCKYANETSDQWLTNVIFFLTSCQIMGRREIFKPWSYFWINRTLAKSCDASSTRLEKERILKSFKKYLALNIEYGNSDDLSSLSTETLDLGMANYILQLKKKDNTEYDTTSVSTYSR